MHPPLEENLHYDAVMKDVFQRDRPSLLEEFTGGVAVKQSLNVEFTKVVERRSDLLFLLENRTLFLLDFQSMNDKRMPVRVGVYSLLAHEKYGKPIEALVLYIGFARLTMKDRLRIGAVNVNFRLLDMRDIAADLLIASGRPGDLVLAMLAGGGGSAPSSARSHNRR